MKEQTISVPCIGLTHPTIARLTFRLSEQGYGYRIITEGFLSRDFSDSMYTAKEIAERIAGKRFTTDIIYANAGNLESSGDSAGLMIALTFLSLLTGKALKPGITGTGRIDWNGKILPTGNMLEKAAAAKEAGATTFLMPYDPQQAVGLPSGLNYIIAGTVQEAWETVRE